MDANHPTAGWETVGGKWFRKIQQYTAVFDQDLELDNYVVSGAPYGGALGAFVVLNSNCGRLCA
jgi:vacuolar protein sorting-associated protein 16